MTTRIFLGMKLRRNWVHVGTHKREPVKLEAIIYKSLCKVAYNGRAGCALIFPHMISDFYFNAGVPEDDTDAKFKPKHQLDYKRGQSHRMEDDVYQECTTNTGAVDPDEVDLNGCEFLDSDAEQPDLFFEDGGKRVPQDKGGEQRDGPTEQSGEASSILIPQYNDAYVSGWNGEAHSEYDDNDELMSLDGSSNDEANRRSRFKSFNEATDFKRPINLEVGLKFANHQIYYQTLKQYCIENEIVFKYKRIRIKESRLFAKKIVAPNYRAKRKAKKQVEGSHAEQFTVYNMRRTPKEYVDPYYRTSTFLNAYRTTIGPAGEEYWPPTNCNKILPLEYKIAPGRPKKARKKVVDERQNPFTNTRNGVTTKCGNCGKPIKDKLLTCGFFKWLDEDEDVSLGANEEPPPTHDTMPFIIMRKRLFGLAACSVSLLAPTNSGVVLSCVGGGLIVGRICGGLTAGGKNGLGAGQCS
ncbi:Glycoside hydrolase, family 47 [Senna tora]|uniref:Glycoside hydrolase, family 47 n=1 Tax=Senna tora TaxID=362788 RepID=A0A834W4L5_9FABA|nr:Glycoside hydrolase, family 47 [Senna tora]